MQVSIALVGIGGYGETYLNELLPIKGKNDIRLKAGIDPQPERCTHLNELREAGIPIYSSLNAFFEQDTADLVIISAPIHLHAALTCLALAKGANVLCEKPLAGSLADAALMLEAERQTGKFAAIGYQWSFSDAVLEIKRDILAGRFGRPLHMKTAVLWPRRHSYYQRNDWAGKIKAANGAWVLDSPVNNAAAHYLHNMLFLLGDTLESSGQPAVVEAELYRANAIENYDTAALRVETEAGTDLLFLTAHPVEKECGPLIRYEFEDAVIEYPGRGRTFLARFRSGKEIDYGSPDTTNGQKLWQAVEAVRTGQPVVCGLRTALPQLICAAAAQQSPVREFPGCLLRTQELENDRLTWVEGLFEILMDCYQTGSLPGEIPGISWGVPKTLTKIV